MLTRDFLASRVGIIPGRIDVLVYKRQKRDVWAAGIPVKAERRDGTKKEQRGSTASSDDSDVSFVFTSTELATAELTIEEDDIIQVVGTTEYYSVGSLGEKLLQTRIPAYCSTSGAPTLAP